MRRTIGWSTVTVVTLALAALSVPAYARPLPSDSRIITGKLKNGATWMYRQHDNPPGKMAIIVHVRTGSLNETDAQRGLAHFIEHMGFNGTENFAPGELIPYFESIGMEFGGDVNAFTSFDQTAYMVFTPDTELDQIDKALSVLSDYAYRMLFIKEEIDKERGVVLEESRRGKSAFQRIRDKLWPELFEGSRFAERLPIGKDEILKTAQREEFVDYYRAWYRPENTTLILVGDADYKPFLPMIEKWFGQYKSSEPPREPKGPEFQPFTKQRAMVVTDPEMAMCDVQMMNIRPGRPPTLSVAQARVELVEHIGSWIIGRRFDDRIKEGTASYHRAYASTDNFFNDALMTTASASGEPEDWAKMVEELILEVSRVREFGFTQRELTLAGKEILSDAEHAVKTEPTRNARGFLFGIMSTMNDKEPFLSAQQELDLYKELLPSIGLGEVDKSFKDHFAPGTFAYVVEMVEGEKVAVPSRDDVLATARAAWARKVTPIEREDAPTKLLATMPTPGKVVEQTMHEGLGITSGWLANGVRFYHREMDYKKDSVWVSIALAGGEIEETAKNAGITEVAALAVNEAATSRLASTQFRDILTGKNIQVRARGTGDALTVTITGSPADLDIGLQAAYALLTDGKIEASAFKNWSAQSLQRIEMFSRMPQFKAYEGMSDLLSGSDPRRMMMTKDRVEAQSLTDAQVWFERLCQEAPIEVAVVGDISLDKALPLLAKYVGSLPKRDRSAARLDRLRRLARPTGPLAHHTVVDTVTPQAMAIAGFVGCQGKNSFDRRALDLASQTMSSRLVKTIREDLSLVYSIRARSQAAWIYEDAGMFMSGAPCAPENVEKVILKVHEMYQAFADGGPTDEELANAKKQILENLDTGVLEPTYWWRILQHHDLHHRELDEPEAVRKAYQSYTAEQVRKIFGKYYTPTRQFRVTAVPKKAEPIQEEAKKEQAVPASTDGG